MNVYYPPGTVQYALRLDCGLNRCQERFGFDHSDDGVVRTVTQSDLFERGTINGHACVRLRRVIPDWEVVPREGDPCPVHQRVHGSHGWYYCTPDGFWETTTPGGPVVWTTELRG